MEKSTSRFDWIVVNLIFGVPFVYCLVGAASGHLFLPHGRGRGGDVVLSGPAAWSMVAGVTLLWIGLSVRLGLLRLLPDSARKIVEMIILFAGVALLFASSKLPGVVAA